MSKPHVIISSVAVPGHGLWEVGTVWPQGKAATKDALLVYRLGRDETSAEDKAKIEAALNEIRGDAQHEGVAHNPRYAFVSAIVELEGDNDNDRIVRVLGESFGDWAGKVHIAVDIRGERVVERMYDNEGWEAMHSELAVTMLPMEGFPIGDSGDAEALARGLAALDEYIVTAAQDGDEALLSVLTDIKGKIEGEDVDEEDAGGEDAEDEDDTDDEDEDDDEEGEEEPAVTTTPAAPAAPASEAT